MFSSGTDIVALWHLFCILPLFRDFDGAHIYVMSE